jgi:hypothetical protein
MDPVLELLQGECGVATAMICTDATIDNGTEQITRSDLLVGSTYWARVYAFLGTGSFTICVTADVGAGVPSITNGARLEVHPNPSDGNLSVLSHDLSGTATIYLVDMTGRALYEERLDLTLGTPRALNMAGRCVPGSYILRLSTPAGRAEERVVIH